MALETDLKNIVKISRTNYEILVNGGSIQGYTYDPDALYLVEDTGVELEYISDEEIEAIWNSGEYYIEGNVLYSADSFENGIAEFSNTTVKNGILYI